ncbi:MAG TPA: DsrE family protein [Candidatus Binatia bacterium]|nr:DsrE family protein [Candidatus Binatia bacterium]
MKRFAIRAMGGTMLLLAIIVPARAADAPNDREALSGLKTARAVFDVRAPDRERMIFNLELIKETAEGMAAQRVKPKMIVTFRGPGIRLLTREQAADELAPLISELKGMGVRFEVCTVATRIFKVDKATILPEIVLVGNSLISLIGYQNRGYALVILM